MIIICISKDENTKTKKCIPGHIILVKLGFESRLNLNDCCSTL